MFEKGVYSQYSDISCRYNNREYKGATTWIEAEENSIHHFSELHLKGAARLAFMGGQNYAEIKADKIVGEPNSYLYVGVGQNMHVVQTEADLSFNIRAYEDASLMMPFKLYIHGVSFHMANNSKVARCLKFSAA